MTPDQLLELLSRSASRLAEVTAGVPASVLRAAPAPDEWSAVDVLAHLRSCADVWGDAIRRILAEDAPTIRAVNPRAWIEQTDYPNLAFAPSFDAYVAQRHDLLDVLAPLTPGQWARTATVVGAGKPLERSVQSYAEWLATHERPHVKQVDRAIARITSAGG